MRRNSPLTVMVVAVLVLILSCTARTATPAPIPTPPPLDPVPGLAFPRQAPPEGMFAEMTALLIGELEKVDGCLRVRSEGYDAGILVIWPYDHTVTVDAQGVPEVRDASGAVVARVGEVVRMGGGESHVLDAAVATTIPVACPGPYWIAARGIESVSLNRLPEDSDVAPLLADLAAQGIALPAPEESVAHLLYPEPGIMYALGERGWLHLHRLSSETAARVRAESLPHDLANTMADWVAPPHFYHCGRFIALYLGSDGAVQAALASHCDLAAE